MHTFSMPGMVLTSLPHARCSLGSSLGMHSSLSHMVGE